MGIGGQTVESHSASGLYFHFMALYLSGLDRVHLQWAANPIYFWVESFGLRGNTAGFAYVFSLLEL